MTKKMMLSAQLNSWLSSVPSFEADSAPTGFFTLNLPFQDPDRPRDSGSHTRLGSSYAPSPSEVFSFFSRWYLV